MKLEELANKLLEGEFSSMHVMCDEHKSSYQTAKEAIDGREYFSPEDFVSPEEMQRAIEDNSIWSLQWYPHTPVGFCVMHASSFQAILDYLALETLKGGEHP